MIHDYSTLKQGDTVTFMITGMTANYKGTILTPNGYQNRPEIKVTHRKGNIHEEWQPDTSWDQFTLKGDDYVLIEKI